MMNIASGQLELEALARHMEIATDPQKSLNSALSAFSPYGINDLEKAKLMDRVETKFLFPFEDMPSLLEPLSDQYSVLEIDGRRIFNYDNIYLDTEDYRFYSMHHNGELHRYKVRHRSYRETGTGFLEIKYKNNKRRTEKTRIRMDSFSEESLVDAQAFLCKGLNGEYQDLETKYSSSYKRITLANEGAGERVTLDFDLCFMNPETDEINRMSDWVIAEVKQERSDRSSPFIRLMKRSAIRPGSFSKYCLGCCVVAGSDVKTNRFKPQLSHHFN